MYSREAEKLCQWGLDQLSGLPWANAIQQKDFGGALSLVEEELARTADCAGSRLWWVRCQLELENLPATALTAPLEELSSKLEGIPELFHLAASTFYRIGDTLQEKNQLRLSLVMLERARSFAELAGDLAQGEWLVLNKRIGEVLERELKRAELRRENKKYISSLQEKLNNQSKAIKKHHKQTTVDKHEKKDRLSSKTVLAAALNGPKSEEQGKELAWQLGGEKDLEVLTGETSQQGESERRDESGKRKFFLPGVMMLVLIVAAGYLALERFGQISEAADSRLALDLPIAHAAKFDPPILGPATGSKSSLAEVGKRLQQLSVKKDKPVEEKGSDRPGQEAVKAEQQEIDREALNPSLAANLPKRKENEDQLESMSGPDSKRNDISRNNVPKMDPEKFARTRVEEIGTSPRKAPVPEDESTKAPDAATDSEPPQQPSSTERALDGTPLRSYEVNKFNPPIRYRTITATDVLSSPSLLASSMARLEQNTPVDVTAKMGQWLELRSTAGRIGYIYAQDAVEDGRKN